MPIPTTITDLSATIASNSPAGSDSPINGDDFLRAHAAFIRQVYDTSATNLTNLTDSTTATHGDYYVAVLNTTTGAVATTQHEVNEREVNLFTFLSTAQKADVQSGTTPTLDVSAALASFWTALQTKGGKGIIPRGGYLCASQWVLTVSAPVNIKIDAWGAVLYATAAVTGSHVKVLSSYNQAMLDIEGLGFNHRGNTTAQGCFEILGGHCVTLERCNVEQHNTKAGWYFAKFSSSTPGASEDTYNSFWCKVSRCNTRMRSGGDGTNGAYGLLLEGAVNAFESEGNTWSDLVDAVHVIAAPTTKTLPNSLTVEKDSFESVTTAAISCVGTPGQLGPTGWRIQGNRIETCPTFFSLTTGGAAMTQHSQPPYLTGNYCTAGSVTTWVNNPTGYSISLWETRATGFGPAFDNHMYMAGGMRMSFTTNGGLQLTDGSGGHDYATGWIKFGYYYWTNTGSAKLYTKASAPANNTDGVVVGTQV